MDRPILVTHTSASGVTKILLTYCPADLAEMFSPDERDFLAKGRSVVRAGQWPVQSAYVDLQAYYSARYSAAPTASVA